MWMDFGGEASIVWRQARSYSFNLEQVSTTGGETKYLDMRAACANQTSANQTSTLTQWVLPI